MLCIAGILSRQMGRHPVHCHCHQYGEVHAWEAALQNKGLSKSRGLTKQAGNDADVHTLSL